MAHTTTWTTAFEATPPMTGTLGKLKYGDDRIREVKTSIRERMGEEHYHTISGDQTLHGSHRYNYALISASQSINKDYHYIIVNINSAVTLTLPAISTIRRTSPNTASQEFIIVCISSTNTNSLTLTAATGELLDINQTQTAVTGKRGSIVKIWAKNTNTWATEINTHNTPDIIVAYRGNVAAIPQGWLICDGTNGTPNLKGKFIVGQDTGNSNYNTLYEAGGAKKHQLSVSQMASHYHSYDYNAVTGGNIGGASAPRGGINNTTASGSTNEHENRPPYYTLAFIMRA
jgi:microcystin-dependent protein